MTKKVSIIWLFLFVFLVSLHSQTRVEGYYRKNGPYVEPHYRSSPDGTKSNNYSTKGNYNPYTGKEGTKNVEETSTYGYTGTYQVAPKKKIQKENTKKIQSSFLGVNFYDSKDLCKKELDNRDILHLEHEGSIAAYNTMFGGYRWDIVNFIFNDNRMCAVSFMKINADDKGALEKFESVKNTLSSKYKGENDLYEGTKPFWYYVNGNYRIELIYNKEYSVKGEYLYPTMLIYFVIDLSDEVVKSNADEL